MAEKRLNTLKNDKIYGKINMLNSWVWLSFFPHKLYTIFLFRKRRKNGCIMRKRMHHEETDASFLIFLMMHHDASWGKWGMRHPFPHDASVSSWCIRFSSVFGREKLYIIYEEKSLTKLKNLTYWFYRIFYRFLTYLSVFQPFLNQF